MPAWRYTSAAHSAPPSGSTVSRSADMVGSLRIAVPCTHATGSPTDAAASPTVSLPSTRAHAPSLDGQVSAYRIGSHSIRESFTESNVMSGSWRWAYGLRTAF